MASVGSELGFPVHKLPALDKKLVLPFAKVGIEIECENVPKTLNQKLLTAWQQVTDGSLRNNGKEFITRGGLVGADIAHAVDAFCKVATDNKFDVGYPRAGIHLHIDVTDMNETSNTQMLNCIRAYMLFEEAVFNFAGQWRKACGFCDPFSMSQQDFPSMAKLLYGWGAHAPAKLLNERAFSKYQAINFLPMGVFGTLEFRQLATTFDAERIMTWINICLSFKRFGMVVDRNPLDILDKLGFAALCKLVFGPALPSVAPFISERDCKVAAADVMAMSILTKPQLSDSPWDMPDNPLLQTKRAA